MDEEIINKNRNINRGYRKLDIWKESVELFGFVKKKMDMLTNLNSKIKSQIEASIFGVNSNIAEGYCRRHLKENIRFSNIALASLGENYSQIFTLLNANIIDKNWFDEYDKMHYALENKIINYIKQQIKMVKDDIDWKNDYLIKELNIRYTDSP
ncbi:MAG: four helix bundle protein [Ignavibacterium album]|uniref:four helix bundle protein n=1 Tax=Ignavibacterium album TaxID=591197 RepID=UPI0026F01994|nr:four helix bundle protein [Ignavibacterium album]MCX8106292.1 four helix bundle protein [Ignavibacterium album]